MTWDSEIKRIVQEKRRVGQIFHLSDVYEVEPHFAKLYRRNRHRRDKLRQALQHLRDQGILQFVDRRPRHRPTRPVPERIQSSYR